MMLTRYILLGCLVVLVINADNIPLRTYEMQKDILNFLGRICYSVCDASKKCVYRISSKSWLSIKFDLLVEPSKKIVGKSEGSNGGIKIGLFNKQSNEWSHANIEHQFSVFKYKRIIHFNGQKMFVQHTALTGYTSFHNETGDGVLLAESKKNILIVVPTNTHKLSIYSNDFPDSLYLLALAWIDVSVSRHSKGK